MRSGHLAVPQSERRSSARIKKKVALACLVYPSCLMSLLETARHDCTPLRAKSMNESLLTLASENVASFKSARSCHPRQMARGQLEPFEASQSPLRRDNTKTAPPASAVGTQCASVTDRATPAKTESQPPGPQFHPASWQRRSRSQ